MLACLYLKQDKELDQRITHMAYIQIRELKKTFENKKGDSNEVLKGINLDVEKGDIYGIIGYSGAGKSTLIRCINGLERPDSGTITIDGENITQLNEKQLMTLRERIGIIFQHFNLLKSKTVFENIALPLRYKKIPAKQIEERVGELLETVGLTEKKTSYPSLLSGGQKQRVAIARALAEEPSLLLCDEATSALDPQTTDSILDLLSKLNKELGLTIILITHQMNVIQRICNKVAVIDEGKIVEQGSTFDVFSKPEKPITKTFLSSIFKGPADEDLNRVYGDITNGKMLHLIFTGDKASDPILSRVTREFNTNINILYGSIEYIQNKPIGSFYVTIQGIESDVESAMRELQNESVKIEYIGGDEVG